MPVFRKSTSKQNINIFPYLRSASSKLSLSALSSTSSIGALFSSSTSTSGSSKSIFTSGTRGGIVNGNAQDKENTSPSPTTNKKSSPRDKSKKDKAKKGGMYPEISAPLLTPESLEAVKARFTLVPLTKTEPYMEEADMVIVSEVDYRDMPPQKSVRST